VSVKMFGKDMDKSSAAYFCGSRCRFVVQHAVQHAVQRIQDHGMFSDQRNSNM